MAQFPFAHTLEITHRINDGSLEIETTIENLSDEPMPLCIGFHPYFQLTNSPRDDWELTIPASDSVVLSDKLLPTGKTTANTLQRPLPLAGGSLDGCSG
jgi:aldose 1-epimerase